MGLCPPATSPMIIMRVWYAVWETLSNVNAWKPIPTYCQDCVRRLTIISICCGALILQWFSSYGVQKPYSAQNRWSTVFLKVRTKTKGGKIFLKKNTIIPSHVAALELSHKVTALSLCISDFKYYLNIIPSLHLRSIFYHLRTRKHICHIPWIIPHAFSLLPMLFFPYHARLSPQQRPRQIVLSSKETPTSNETTAKDRSAMACCVLNPRTKVAHPNSSCFGTWRAPSTSPRTPTPRPKFSLRSAKRPASHFQNLFMVASATGPSTLSHRAGSLGPASSSAIYVMPGCWRIAPRMWMCPTAPRWRPAGPPRLAQIVCASFRFSTEPWRSLPRIKRV